MYISRDEYKLLKQFYKSDGFAIKNDISDVLLEKGFLQHKQIKIMRDSSRQCSAELVITNSGTIACEDYADFKTSNFRSWAAIFISILSLLISLVSLYGSVF